MPDLLPGSSPLQGPIGGQQLVGCILTLNEEDHIVDAVRSLRQLTATVVVVDSGSVDKTVEKAEKAGAAVWVHPFESYPSQRNWAVAEIQRVWDPAWILSIDADERVTNELASEVRALLAAGDPDADVLLVPLRVTFAGRVLRFGGFGRTRLPRLYRPSAGSYEARAVNEHFTAFPGARLGTLRNPLVHQDVLCWERHIAKHNSYSTLEARARLQHAVDRTTRTSLAAAIRNPYLRRRWLRQRIWDRLPARPVLRFFQMYVVRAGVLDGAAGFKVALFQSWHEMCIDLKYRELVTGRQTALEDQAASATGLPARD